MKKNRMNHPGALEPPNGIAITGLACRFPEAQCATEFWQNLKNGVASISFFSDQELQARGVDPATLSAPNYVKAEPALADIEWFDASFFEVSAREAELMDPQQRIFLECAWEALENAGYAPQTHPGRVGVYAGAAISSYLVNNLVSRRHSLATSGDTTPLTIVNDKDYLSTRVSYKLDLKGPSITVQSACSTSLVAVHLACESLLNRECDVALAGGITVKVPQIGYFYQQGSVHSPDGHCRVFDARAEGTVFGSGAGVVVLKRLADALEDRDHICAVIRGSAINNDGASKVGYTAPSVDGQAAVIAEALTVARVDPETITYVEAHGTGTPLGDPVEIAALTQAFRLSTGKKGFCAVGAVKTNIGHSAAAAGVAGLIKTVLALEHKKIPPSLNFERPNPKIDFENSPFYVNTHLAEWETDGSPRRAGVSSFGMGGTNAHVVVEEAPPVEPAGESRPWQLLPLSAKTATALDTMTVNLTTHLRQHPDLNLADVAYTLQTGRQTFNHRRVLVCRDGAEAARALETLDPHQVFTGFQQILDRPVVFMFSGQGAQYANMGQELYQVEPTFRKEVDRCCELVAPRLGFDLREVLFPGDERTAEATEQLTQTAITQPALFVVEYSLAKLWMAWGVRPQAMVGHSIGEYVAACLAGVFSLPDALALVSARGRLMQQMPPGAMLALGLPEQEARSLLQNGLALAAVNEPSRCVISGPPETIENLQHQLAGEGVMCRRLHTSRAFHSGMMTPIVKPFVDTIRQFELSPPQIPYLSNVSGDWITAAEATDPEYWGRHLLQTVRFGDNLERLLKQPESVLLEIGPGRTLCTFATRHPDRTAGQVVVSSLRHPQDRQSDAAFLLTSLGKLWLAGVPVDWAGFCAHERRYRLPLPSYSFERQRYWIEPSETAQASASPGDSPKRQDIADWFYVPSWKRSVALLPPGRKTLLQSPWLVFADAYGLGPKLVKELEQQGQTVITVREGTAFAKLNQRAYALDPGNPTDYDVLLDDLAAQGKPPSKILHLWSVTRDDQVASTPERAAKAQDLGFYSLLFLAQALGRQSPADEVQITVVSNGIQEVTTGQALHPEKATVLGPVRVIPREYPNINCRSVDIAAPNPEMGPQRDLTDVLLAELVAESSDQIVAYHGGHRWVQTFEAVRLDEAFEGGPQLKQKGVYLITGGLGGIGLALAEHLARTVQAKLVLTGRSAFPSRNEWKEWLAGHDDQDSISHKIRKLVEFEELGSEVLIIEADVANEGQMRAAVVQSLERFGRLDGVIHAAGVPGGGVMQRKTRKEAGRVLLPKVRGTLVLDAVLKDVKLDLFVLCSSLTSVLGTFGQVDYGAANAFLDAFTHYRNCHVGPSTVCINWDAWQQVGMAAAAARQSSGALDTPAQTIHPLLGQRLDKDPTQETYITHLSVAKHWVLHEHQIAGQATVPGTAYLEMARAAFKDQIGNGIVEIREVFFLAPLVVGQDEEKKVCTILQKQKDGFEFLVASHSDPAQDEWQEHARGKIALGKTDPSKECDIKEIEARCSERQIVPGQEHTSRSGLIQFGPRWSNLKQVKLGQDQGLAVLELPEPFAAETGVYELHPALLDTATSFLASEYGGNYLPFSYGRLIVRGPWPKKAYSYARHRRGSQSHQESLSFDITIMDEQGQSVVEIEDYTLLAVSEGGREKASLPASRLPTHLFPSTGAGDASQNLLKEGLSPQEGVVAFDRILSSALPQVLVSTHDLPARIKQRHARGVSRLLDQVASVRPTRPRPELGNVYVAPRNETEQTLAGVWQTFLGVERVGIHDNFFELGGDSLLATQAISRVRETLQVEVPMAIFFERPTVAGLAEFAASLRWATQEPRSFDQAPASDLERGKL